MSLVEEWPEGLGFHPTDAQLVDCHLRKKLNGKTQTFLLIPELDIYKHEPWDLFCKYNELSDLPSDGQECFFFCPQRSKTRSNRKTKHGFWKCTCQDRPVRDQDGKQIGTKKIFVGYKGRQRKGCNCKTNIVMHEYHRGSDIPASTISGLKTFVVCRILRQKQKKTSSAIEVAQETVVEASPEATIESENQSESSNFNVPESSKSSPQLTQMDQESRSWCHGDWGIDASYNNLINMPYSLSDGISIMDLGYDNVMGANMPHPLSNDTSIMDLETNMPYSPSNGISILDLGYDNLINASMSYPSSNGISTMDLGYDNLWNFN